MPSVLNFGQTIETIPPEWWDSVTTKDGKNLTWPEGFSVIDGKFCYATVDPNTGVVSNIPFCDSVFYGEELIWTEDGEYSLAMVSVFNGKRHRFVLPLSQAASHDKLAAVLAAQSIFLYGKIGRIAAMQSIQEFVRTAKLESRVVHTEQQFGWSSTYDSFIIGNVRTNGKTDEKIRLGGLAVSGGFDVDFGMVGTRNGWIELVNDIYNRDGAELYQFAILASACAPLISMAGFPNFHGLPIAYTGSGGGGKTTACEVACSIWGNPGLFLRSSNMMGTTINGILGTLSVFRHLPILFDELTGHNARDFGDLLYAFSNGRAKTRMTQSGGFVGGTLRWDTIPFITGNDNLSHKLSELDNDIADATSVRCFEIRVPNDIVSTVFKDIMGEAKSRIELAMMSNYGVVGRELIRAYIANRDKIVRRLVTMRGRFSPNTTEETRERYYTDLIAFVTVAGEIMQKLGLIYFNLSRVQEWALENVKLLRATRKSRRYTDEELIGQFLNSLGDKTLRTKKLYDGRSGKVETPLTDPKLPPEAREAIDDKRFFVTRKIVREWCLENRIDYSAFVDMMDRHGYIVHRALESGKKHADKMYIGIGTTRITGQARVFELDYDMVHKGFKTETEGNVTRIVDVNMEEQEEAA